MSGGHFEAFMARTQQDRRVREADEGTDEGDNSANGIRYTGEKPRTASERASAISGVTKDKINDAGEYITVHTAQGQEVDFTNWDDVEEFERQQLQRKVGNVSMDISATMPNKNVVDEPKGERRQNEMEPMQKGMAEDELYEQRGNLPSPHSDRRIIMKGMAEDEEDDDWSPSKDAEDYNDQYNDDQDSDQEQYYDDSPSGNPNNGQDGGSQDYNNSYPSNNTPGGGGSSQSAQAPKPKSTSSSSSSHKSSPAPSGKSVPAPQYNDPTAEYLYDAKMSTMKTANQAGIQVEDHGHYVVVNGKEFQSWYDAEAYVNKLVTDQANSKNTAPSQQEMTASGHPKSGEPEAQQNVQTDSQSKGYSTSTNSNGEVILSAQDGTKLQFSSWQEAEDYLNQVPSTSSINQGKPSYLDDPNYGKTYDPATGSYKTQQEIDADKQYEGQKKFEVEQERQAEEARQKQKEEKARGRQNLEQATNDERQKSAQKDALAQQERDRNRDKQDADEQQQAALNAEAANNLAQAGIQSGAYGTYSVGPKSFDNASDAWRQYLVDQKGRANSKSEWDKWEKLSQRMRTPRTTTQLGHGSGGGYSGNDLMPEPDYMQKSAVPVRKAADDYEGSFQGEDFSEPQMQDMSTGAQIVSDIQEPEMHMWYPNPVQPPMVPPSDPEYKVAELEAKAAIEAKLKELGGTLHGEVPGFSIGLPENFDPKKSPSFTSWQQAKDWLGTDQAVAKTELAMRESRGKPMGYAEWRGKKSLREAGNIPYNNNSMIYAGESPYDSSDPIEQQQQWEQERAMQALAGYENPSYDPNAMIDAGVPPVDSGDSYENQEQYYMDENSGLFQDNLNESNQRLSYLDWKRKRLSEGGEGSGNFDHAGRPGEVGGSAPQSDGTIAKKTTHSGGERATRAPREVANAKYNKEKPVRGIDYMPNWYGGPYGSNMRKFILKYPKKPVEYPKYTDLSPEQQDMLEKMVEEHDNILLLGGGIVDRIAPQEVVSDILQPAAKSVADALDYATYGREGRQIQDYANFGAYALGIGLKVLHNKSKKKSIAEENAAIEEYNDNLSRAYSETPISGYLDEKTGEVLQVGDPRIPRQPNFRDQGKISDKLRKETAAPMHNKTNISSRGTSAGEPDVAPIQYREWSDLTPIEQQTWEKYATSKGDNPGNGEGRFNQAVGENKQKTRGWEKLTLEQQQSIMSDAKIKSEAAERELSAEFKRANSEYERKLTEFEKTYKRLPELPKSKAPKSMPRWMEPKSQLGTWASYVFNPYSLAANVAASMLMAYTVPKLSKELHRFSQGDARAFNSYIDGYLSAQSKPQELRESIRIIEGDPVEESPAEILNGLSGHVDNENDPLVSFIVPSLTEAIIGAMRELDESELDKIPAMMEMIGNKYFSRLNQDGSVLELGKNDLPVLSADDLSGAGFTEEEETKIKPIAMMLFDLGGLLSGSRILTYHLNGDRLSEGGVGSGNFAHAGRPGMVGGSGFGAGVRTAAKVAAAVARDSGMIAKIGAQTAIKMAPPIYRFLKFAVPPSKLAKSLLQFFDPKMFAANVATLMFLSYGGDLVWQFAKHKAMNAVDKAVFGEDEEGKD